MTFIETGIFVAYVAGFGVYFAATLAAVPNKPRSVRFQFVAVLAAAATASTQVWDGRWMSLSLWLFITAAAGWTLRNKRRAVSDV